MKLMFLFANTVPLESETSLSSNASLIVWITLFLLIGLAALITFLIVRAMDKAIYKDKGK